MASGGSMARAAHRRLRLVECCCCVPAAGAERSGGEPAGGDDDAIGSDDSIGRRFACVAVSFDCHENHTHTHVKDDHE